MYYLTICDYFTTNLFCPWNKHVFINRLWWANLWWSSITTHLALCYFFYFNFSLILKDFKPIIKDFIIETYNFYKSIWHMNDVYSLDFNIIFFHVYVCRYFFYIEMHFQLTIYTIWCRKKSAIFQYVIYLIRYPLNLLDILNICISQKKNQSRQNQIFEFNWCCLNQLDKFQCSFSQISQFRATKIWFAENKTK